MKTWFSLFIFLTSGLKGRGREGERERGRERERFEINSLTEKGRKKKR
jgi:hypothetical protein